MLFLVVTEFILSSNRFSLFVFTVSVGALVLLTPIINHARMFIAVGQHSNQVAGAVASNQQQTIILRRKKKVAYDMMILIAALLVSLGPITFLKALQSTFS